MNRLANTLTYLPSKKHGQPLRMRSSGLCRYKVRCSGALCCYRLVRPAAALVFLFAMLSLAFLAGLNSRESCADTSRSRDDFAIRAIDFHIPGRLEGSEDKGTTNAGALLAASGENTESRRVSIVASAQTRFSAPEVSVISTAGESPIEQNSVGAECMGRAESSVPSNASQSSCNAAAPWQVDYASRAGVRCDLLVAGEPSELIKAEQFLNDSRENLSCSAADALLAAASCDDIRAAGYGKQTDAKGSRNAKDGSYASTFRLAFGIRLHRCAVQAELLLRSIYAPQHLYCLHVDGKAGANVLAAMTLLAACLPNVLLAPPDNDFVYGSVSQLHADITCMRFLLNRDTVPESSKGDGDAAVKSKWRYFLNVAGQELPLRSNEELVALLRAYNGTNDVASQTNPNIRWRYASKTYCKLANGTTVRCPRSARVIKDAPPGNVTVYKGFSYGFFSRALVEYALRPGGFGAQLYDWIADTWAPDEQYFATLVRQPDAPGGYREYARPKHPTARAVKWSGYRYDTCHGVMVRGVCVLGVGDLPWLDKQWEAFANKFDYERDPLAVQCLVQHTLNASRPRKPLIF